MHRRRLFARVVCFFVAAASCAACEGDYWLGGSRGSTGGSAGSVPVTSGYDLSGDIVLSGDQTLELGADDAGACRIVGNGHGIRSVGSWSGHLVLRDCTIVGLGSASTEAIALDMHGSGFTTIERSTFDASGQVHLRNYDDSTTTFRNNVILDNSVVHLDPSADKFAPAFLTEGSGTASKVFQGNRVYRSSCRFQSPNWLIGGDTDQDSNIVIGLRGGFDLEASDLVVRGNYVHNFSYPSSGDESALSVGYDYAALAEHNVLRHGTWVIRGFGGELRYNAILDADNLSWLQQPFQNTKVHHNVFMMCQRPVAGGNEGVQGGIEVVNSRAVGIEIFNNTLDGGGRAMLLTGPAVSVDGSCFLSSFRSNVIFNVPFYLNGGGEAAIQPGIAEGPVNPLPARLGYADYNLFFNTQAGALRNYGLSVSNLVLRKDAGFGLHDAHAMGPVDEQVDPGLLGLSGGCFPFSDDDIKAGTVTVSHMLSTWRAAYSPVPGGPLVGTGDPADGSGNPIGAIGDGTKPTDRFGTFGR